MAALFAALRIAHALVRYLRRRTTLLEVGEYYSFKVWEPGKNGGIVTESSTKMMTPLDSCVSVIFGEDAEKMTVLRAVRCRSLQ